jgi:Uncharacterized conserved protein
MKKNGRNKSANEASNVRSLLVPIVFCLVCGILLIVLDNLALMITAYVLAGVMLLCGGWYAVQYLRSSPAQRIREIRLASGLILLVAGILLAFNPGYLESILPFVWGLALLFGGSLKIQYAFDEYSLQVKKWWIMLILAALSIILGIVSLLNPAFLGDRRYLIIGILLVCEAVLDILVTFLLRHALKKEQSGPEINAIPREKPAPAEQVPSPSSDPEPPAAD